MVINGQNLLAIKSNINKCHISLRKPEVVDFLVLAHKVCPLDPERKLLCRMAINPYNGVIFRVNPYLAFESIFVSPFGNHLRNETVVGSNPLLSEQVQRIVCRGDSAVVMLLTRRGFDLTGD